LRNTIPGITAISLATGHKTLKNSTVIGGFRLQTGLQLKADFDGSNDADFEDYCTVADLWLKLCPVGWPLKD